MKQKDILFLVIPFFVLVLVYIIFSVYHDSVTSTISENLDIQIIPIPPDFNQKIISDIKKRDQITPLYQISPQPSVSSSAQKQ
ncbi:MAG TPA: hypothetical protein VFA93_03125 [Patescibacteria group bacterium]|nr:hypothetical protein [Patescibacteria group bacterium]